MLILQLFPVLLKVFLLDGMLTLALAYSQGAGRAPDVTCRFNREEGIGSHRDFLWAVLVFQLLLGLVMSLIGGLLPTFLWWLAFIFVLG